jgi:AraC-like DNA-binding protein
MEKIYEPNLLYAQEHFSCPNYLDEVKYGFRYRKYAKGTLLERDSTYAYTILFVHQGIVRLNYNGYQERDIYAGEMFLIDIGSPFYIEFLEDTTALAMIFESWNFHCVVSPLSSLKPFYQDTDYNTNILEINPQLRLFLQLQAMYIRNGVQCAHWHKTKIDEFFLILRCFYSKERLSVFLAPLLGGTSPFRKMCLELVSKARTVNGMIELSGMSRSSFYEQFSAEFGNKENPKEWLNEKFKYRVLCLASTADITVKELTFRLGFESVSSFCQYCKRHFDKTPQALIQTQSKVVHEL